MHEPATSRRTVVKTSLRGHLYLDWAPMPRVPNEYAECIVYLYPDLAAAEAGERLGGTGFVVGVRGVLDPTLHFLYVVTNYHIVDDGYSTVRINTKDGKYDAIELDERNWIRGPKDIDLAIYEVADLDQDKFHLRVAEINDFITREEMSEYDIGVGSDVFYLGRFVNVEGRSRNMPTLRFGTVAQIPIEPVDGKVSFLVEARSIPGFSGSPVFLYVPKPDGSVVASPLGLRKANTGTLGLRTTPGYRQALTAPKLLGVDWGHINDYMDCYDDRGKKLAFRVKSNSGLMTVVPIWFLEQMLNHPDVKRMREYRETEIIRNRSASADAASASRLKPASGDEPSAKGVVDENPQHLEDFTALLNAAAKTKPQAD